MLYNIEKLKADLTFDHAKLLLDGYLIYNIELFYLKN